MILLKLIHSQLLVLLAGGLAASLIYRRRSRKPPPWEFLSLSYLLGTGILGVLLFFVMFLGGFLTHSWAVLISLSAGTGWLALERKKVKKLMRDPALVAGYFGQLKNRAKMWGWIEILLLFLVLLLLFQQLNYAIRLPLVGFDSRAHWGLKTKILHHEGTFYSKSFYDSERIHPQVRHPLLLPITEVLVTLSLGRYDDRLMKIPLVMIFASILALFYSETRRYHSRAVALGFTLFLASIPRMTTPGDGGITSGYADAPLAFYFLATLIFLVRWIRSGEMKDAVCASLLAVFTMYIKDDGIGCLASAFPALILAALFCRKWLWKKRIPILLLTGAVILILVLPARIFSHSLSVGKGEYFEGLLNMVTLRKNLDRLDVIFTSYKLEFLWNLPNWGFLWIILLISAIWQWKRFGKMEVRFLAFTILFFFGVLTVIFLILPWNLRHFFAGSLARLIMHAAPASIFLIALFWKPEITEMHS